VPDESLSWVDRRREELVILRDKACTFDSVDEIPRELVQRIWHLEDVSKAYSEGYIAGRRAGRKLEDLATSM